MLLGMRETSRWPGALLERAGLTQVTTDHLGECLRALGDRDLDFVAFKPESTSGGRAVEEIRRFIATVRESAPSAGVGAFYDNPVSVQGTLLGPRAWIITPATRSDEVASMLVEVREARTDRIPLARHWPAHPPLAVARTRPTSHDRVVPAFRVESPEFLSVLAALSVRHQTMVVCEIHPQEALCAWPHQRRGGVRNWIAAALGQVSADVKAVCEATGADLKLHLARCDDPRVIVTALDLGFESITADASGRSLHARTSFIRSALRWAHTRGALVEVEVGGSRREMTDPERVRLLLDLVQPDYIAVNIGQVPSCEEDCFNRTLAASRDLSELDSLHGDAEDVASAFDCAVELQGALARCGLLEGSDERRIVGELQDRLARGEVRSVSAWLDTAERSVSAGAVRSLANLRHRWVQHRIAVAEDRARLRRAINCRRAASEEAPEGALDFALLEQLRWVARRAGTRLVLRGADSIGEADLGRLQRYGVGRISFGNGPSSRFLRSLGADSALGWSR